jgi:hypothetical protein
MLITGIVNEAAQLTKSLELVFSRFCWLVLRIFGFINQVWLEVVRVVSDIVNSRIAT